MRILSASAGPATGTKPTSRILGAIFKVTLDLPNTDWRPRGRKGGKNSVKTDGFRVAVSLSDGVSLKCVADHLGDNVLCIG